jgi:hypothetical protein
MQKAAKIFSIEQRKVKISTETIDFNDVFPPDHLHKSFC